MANFSENTKKIKTVIKKVTFSFLIKLLSISLPFIIIIILLSGAFDALMEGYSEKVSNYIKENPVKYNIQDNSVVIDDAMISELKKMLEDSKIDTKNMQLTDGNIERMYAAELVTQEINRGVIGEDPYKYYGRVYVKKIGSSIDDLQEMKYVPLEEFNNMNTDEILNCFSVENDNICLASLRRTTASDGTVTSEITKKSLNYKNYILQYVMPFEFLADLLAITNNPEFVMAIAEKVLNETEIIIGVMQNETSIETVVTHTYQVASETSIQHLGPNNEVTRVETYDPSIGETQEEVQTETIKTIEPTIKLISANTWIINKKMNYNILEPTPQVTVIPPEDERNYIEPETKPNHDNYIIERQGGTTYGRSTVQYKINEKKSIQITTTTTTYQQGTVEQEDKAEDIIKLLRTRYVLTNGGTRSAFGDLQSGFDIFINMLRKSERTENMENIIRYIMYVATGNAKYGVTEFPYDIYKEGNLISAGGELKNLIRYWEFGNSTPDLNEDGTKYKVFNDGFDNPTVGYGITIKYNYDRLVKNGYTEYTKEEIMQNYEKRDIYIEKEIVDAVEDEIIAEKRALVKGLGLNLTTYQEYALTLRAYNYNLSGFVEAYNQYWNPNIDNEKYFEKNVDYTHKLYTEYMSEPTYSNGKYAPGLRTRRDAEWALFSAGYYTHTKTYWTESGEGVVDFALQFVGENHTRFTNYKTSDGVQFWGDNWCAMFVSYCFDQMGLIPSVLKESYVGCSNEYRNLKSRNEWEYGNFYGGNYTPSPGDIIFFTPIFCSIFL